MAVCCCQFDEFSSKRIRTDFEAGTDYLISTSSVADFSQCGVTRRQVTHPARDVPQPEKNPRTLTAHRKTLCSVQARFYRRLSVRYLAVATRRRGRSGPQKTAASVVEEEFVRVHQSPRHARIELLLNSIVGRLRGELQHRR